MTERTRRESAFCLSRLRHPGVAAALAAALLFGAGTPLAKLLLDTTSPWLLAGLLYLGSGCGLALYRRLAGSTAVQVPRGELPWLAGAILSGGVIAPILLMVGLARMPAADVSLLLNVESVFTAMLAWFVFRENFDRRTVMGMAAIAAGAVALSWPGEAHMARVQPALAVLGAGLAWAVDNNLTRKVSTSDATWIASVKGLVSGVVNLALAAALGAQRPALSSVGLAMTVGFFAYGVSLALFVVALRHLGTARTGAYFAVAPFFGALLALVSGEPLTTGVVVAGALMAAGIWLHLTEHHDHAHVHAPLEHDHAHVHDAHHLDHVHDAGDGVVSGPRHRHPHRHAPTTHSHAHFPDVHHGHDHD